MRPHIALDRGCGRSQEERHKENAMPEIIIYLAEGRTVDAKRAVVKDITDTVVKNFNVTAENVAIQIVEAPKENKAKGGLLFIDR
jgi:4-oxalocrotonate tautomerase